MDLLCDRLSVVSCDKALSKGLSGESGLDSTRAICTALGRLLVGSMRMSAMKPSHTVAYSVR